MACVPDEALSLPVLCPILYDCMGLEENMFIIQRESSVYVIKKKKKNSKYL